MANLINGIISLAVSAVILSTLFITQIKNTNQSYTCVINTTSGATGSCSWTTGEISMWGLLTLVAIVGFVYGTLNVFGIM